MSADFGPADPNCPFCAGTGRVDYVGDDYPPGTCACVCTNPRRPRVEPRSTMALKLAQLALQFSRVNRATMHEDGARWETDSDHTVMLGLVACAWARALEPQLDVGLIAQLALVHDLPEALCGDTNSFAMSNAERKAKAAREQGARDQLLLEYGLSLPWLPDTVNAYEDQLTPEAHYVNLMDKILTKFTHILNGGKALDRMGASYGRLIARHRAQLDELSGAREPFPSTFALLEWACSRAETAYKWHD